MRRLTSVLLILVIGASQLLATAASSDTSPNQNSAAAKLIGAWQLVSVETIRPNGQIIYPFYGLHPEGLLVYDRSGWMSVQIVSDPKPTVPAADSRAAFIAAPLRERAAAADGYYAYFGRWKVDDARSTVTHFLVQSLYPGERGETGVRYFTIDDDRLTLVAKTHEMGEDRQRRLVWKHSQ